MTGGAPTELKTVVIRGFPVRLYSEWQRHSEALLREFAFIVDGGGDKAELPKRLLQIVERVRARSAGLNTGAQRAIEDAMSEGAEAVDFELLVPEAFARGAPEFAVLLDEIDEYCRTGDLLTLAMTDELRDFRDWYLGELTRQIDGLPPMAWRQFSRS
jgi:hypothetical protein